MDLSQEISATLFNGRHFNREIIVLCVRWYVSDKLSYRDLVAIMAERNVDVAHATILRWVQRWYCRNVDSNSLLSTMSGIFHLAPFQYVVWFLNFATVHAACNGTIPAGASPVTVLPQEGCVVIPDS